MFNLVELVEEPNPSPCLYGNIVSGHACYCHHEKAPRKCPIWRNYTLSDLSKWCIISLDNWGIDSWDGGCPYFEPNPFFSSVDILPPLK